MSHYDLEGRPCRIKNGTAERLMENFKVFGLNIVCKQTDTALTINGQKINAVRSYTTQRGIDFDHKVHAVIQDVLKENEIYPQNIYGEQKKIKEEINQVSPSLYGKLGDMGNNVDTQILEKFLAAAEAVKQIYNRPDVQEGLKRYDALNALFTDCDEIVKN